MHAIMKIEIDKPVLRCRIEEDAFFRRLSEVSGFRKISMYDSKLYISVTCQFKTEATDEIIAICDMWHTKYKIVYDCVYCNN